MAKLYFYYGAMGSSKTANALMAEYNYTERGQKALLAKTSTDTRDGVNIIRSRIGLQKECILLDAICEMSDEELKQYDAVIVDEIQFAKREQIDFLAHIVDDLNVPVLCYGLRSDFQLNLFEGSERLLAIADEIKEVKTVCWCGKRQHATPGTTSMASSVPVRRSCWEPTMNISPCAGSTSWKESFLQTIRATKTDKNGGPVRHHHCG